MGACYSTEFKLKFKPNGGLTEATEKLNELSHDFQLFY